MIPQPRSTSVSFDRDAAIGDTLAAVAHRREGISAELAAIVAAERDAILDALYRHGALLFRGFDVEGAAGFERITRALTPEAFSYVGGGSPRSRIAGEVYTSTELSADQVIPLHNEASYFAELPAFVWFYSAVAPLKAGETPLGDMRRVLERLDSGLVERFDRNGLCYVSNLHGGSGFGRSWQSTYQSEDRAEVETRIREKGFEFSWIDDETLRVIMRAPALRTHTVTGRAYWGNQVVIWHPADLSEKAAAAMQRLYRDPWKYPKAVFFGDGSPIPTDDVTAVARVLKEQETTFPWQTNDVLLIDNQAIAHGRRPFVGERQIMVALA